MLVRSSSDGVSRRERLLNAAPAAIGLLLWSLTVLALDGLLLFLTAKVIMAQWYPSVPGEITHNERRQKPNSVDGDGWFAAEVRFRYLVNGKEFTSDQLHFLKLRDARREAKVQESLQRYPVGQTVQVIYNPNDPSDSALDRSFNGLPLAFGLFLTPFNLLMAGGWIWLARRVNGTRSLPLRREGNRWCILPTNGQPGSVARTAAGVVSLTLVLAVSVGGWSDNLSAMIATWTALAGVSGLAYWHTQTLVLREPPVLILDDDLATVIWPASADAPEFAVARSRLLAIETSDDSQSTTDSNPTFSISLKFTSDDGPPARRLAFKTNNGLEASSIMDWLEDWTGLSATEPRNAD